MPEKTIEGYLVVNWDDESLKALKNPPRKSSPYEMVLGVNLEVEVPEIDTPTISERLLVPQPTVERLVQQQVTGEEPEEWQAHVDEYIEERLEHGEPIELPEDVHQALGEVMLELEGVQDPRQVEEYIREVSRGVWG